MGQAEVSDFLEKHPDRWYRAVEIARAIGVSKIGIFVPLKVLRKNGEILYRQVPKDRKCGLMYEYKFKSEEEF